MSDVNGIRERYFEAIIAFESAEELLDAAWQAKAKTKEYRRFAGHAGQRPPEGRERVMYELYHDFLRKKLEATRAYQRWKEFEAEYDAAVDEFSAASNAAWATIEIDN